MATKALSPAPHAPRFWGDVDPKNDPDLELWSMKVVERKTGFSASHIYRMIAAGEFPRQRSYRRDGGTKVFFTSTEVRAWQLEQLGDDYDRLLG
jgi:predicted DNA-binding transcriptional regulator AlpA